MQVSLLDFKIITSLTLLDCAYREELADDLQLPALHLRLYTDKKKLMISFLHKRQHSQRARK